MPRNGSGTSSVVNTFVIDTIADPDEVNANFTDVADQLTNSLPRDGQAGMNAPLPLQNGSAAAPALTFTSDTNTGIYRKSADSIGFGANGIEQAYIDTDGVHASSAEFTDLTVSGSITNPQPFATVASATTTDIGAATSQNVTVTGTTTITGFGTVAAGTFRRVVFSGALTLTHNATSLILPQDANLVTTAGDSLEAVSLGSGNWRVTSYQKVGADFLCRAWVVFAGATGTIIASGNVSSVTRNGTGDYTINFATNMPSTDYVTHGTVQGATSSGVDTVNVNNTGGQAVGSVRIICVRAATGAFDPVRVNVSIHGG